MQVQKFVLKRTWHINTVNIQIDYHCWSSSPINSTYDPAPFQKAVLDYISLLSQSGMYAIIELNESGYVSMPDKEESLPFWTQIANTYKGNNAVIFDLFNWYPIDPTRTDSIASWQCWRDGANSGQSLCQPITKTYRITPPVTQTFTPVGVQALVTAIRYTAATNVILLHGIIAYNNYLPSNLQSGLPESFSQWLLYKPNDPLNNIAAAWQYSQIDSSAPTPCGQSSCWNGMLAPIANTVPLIVDTVSSFTAKTNLTNCNSQALDSFFTWLDTHIASYSMTNWTTDPKGNTTGCTSAYQNLLTDYNGTPSTLGQIYKNHISSF